MKKMLQQPVWVWIAGIAILGMWGFSAAWNFGHAYVLAGGDNPMILFEGRLPTWNGPAIAVALAAVAADVVKATAGFLLIAACTNKSLGLWARGGTFALALIVVIPTFAWSARSAMGMVALVFGDTVASRGNEQMVTRSLRDQIEYDQGRLGFLTKQTTTTTRQQLTNSKEADQLRRELEKNRKTLRESRGIGGADPGGFVLAKIMGVQPETVTNWTIFLFIFMIEVGSTLGPAALVLATRISGGDGAPPVLPKAAETSHKSPKDDDDLSNPREEQEKKHYSNGSGDFPQTPSTLHGSGGDLVTYEFPEEEEVDDEPHELEKLKPKRRPGRRGRPRKARMGDGHIEEFVDHCGQSGAEPDRGLYVQFCRDRYLFPMSSNKMWRGMRGRGRLKREYIRKFLEPDLTLAPSMVN